MKWMGLFMWLTGACGPRDVIPSAPDHPAHPSAALGASVRGAFAAAEKPPATRPGARNHAITVTEKGFAPDRITVAKGEPVTLTFTRKTDKTCARQVILQLGGGKTVEKPLPLDEPVAIEVTFESTGELRYACSMDMFAGVVLVQP